MTFPDFQMQFKTALWFKVQQILQSEATPATKKKMTNNGDSIYSRFPLKLCQWRMASCLFTWHIIATFFHYFFTYNPIFIFFQVTLTKYPFPIVLKILSMELFDGRQQLKILKWRLRRCGISFLPPPGWIIAAKNWISTMLVNSPGFSRL